MRILCVRSKSNFNGYINTSNTVFDNLELVAILKDKPIQNEIIHFSGNVGQTFAKKVNDYL